MLLRQLLHIIRRRDNATLFEDDFSGSTVSTRWLKTDTESKISVSGGVLSFSGGKATPGQGDPSILYKARQIRRLAGMRISARLRTTVENVPGPQVILSTASPYDNSSQREYGVNLTTGMSVGVQRGAASVNLPVRYSADTWVDVEAALLETGCLWYVNGVPMWFDPAGSTANLWLVFQTWAKAGDIAKPRVYRGAAPVPAIDTTPAAPVDPATISLAGDAGKRAGVFECLATGLGAAEVAGIRTCLDSISSPQNYLEAKVDRATGKLHSSKCVAGSVTELANGNVTYGDAKRVRIVSYGNSHAAYYDGALIGAAQTVDVSSGFGTLVAGLDPQFGQRFGVVRCYV